MRFGRLIVEFLDHHVNFTSVAHTDQIINYIYQVFFQHGQQDVVGMFVAYAT
jgi:hypothetical protein